jgi:hypothetical protein
MRIESQLFELKRHIEAAGVIAPSFSTGYRLTGGGPSGVLPGARELCPVAVSGAGLVAVGM